jgi:hypothetical protein
VRITRCPRCRAEDISADAHPARLLREREEVPVLVCRGCYRPAELEYRIACENAGVPFAAMPIRKGLGLLRDFYLDRLAEWRDPELLLEDDERERGAARTRAALEDVERRVRIAPVGPPSPGPPGSRDPSIDSA